MLSLSFLSDYLNLSTSMSFRYLNYFKQYQNINQKQTNHKLLSKYYKFKKKIIIVNKKLTYIICHKSRYAKLSQKKYLKHN